MSDPQYLQSTLLEDALACALTLSQMHAVNSSESVLHVGNLLYPPETVYTLQ